MGILHRDIKTENVLIDCRENVKIIDFGLSYLEPTGKPLDQGGRYAIEFLGTPPYMAPEVLRNKGMPIHRRRRYGPAVDWWGLGCILFELESRDHMVRYLQVSERYCLLGETDRTLQLLFDTEEDVHTYVAWTQRPCQLEQMYPRFEGLDPVIVNLLEGVSLVFVSCCRFGVSDMKYSAFAGPTFNPLFLRRPGKTRLFSALQRVCLMGMQ